MGSFNPTYTVPEFEETEAVVTHEFKWEDCLVVVEARTGMVRVNAGWTERPERIVAFEGWLYESSSKEELLGEYEMFHIDTTLHPLPRWMEVLARLGNEEEPGSVEEFFYDFMFQLGYDAGFIVPPDDIRDSFETIAEELVSEGAFADSSTERESSWKPYCTIYANEFIEWGV